ncbi:hypothetical protein V6N13_111192 [Hibiscus sabdariffa]|uniref:Gamma-secretase subunit PEN-2 n=1 Tax=Hibiscus sabdariffa TaxID=183260 RepID=A0ABR2TJF3_9ROSI
MEASQSQASTSATQNPNPTNSNSILSSTPLWPTIDGPLGLSEEDSLSYARRFYNFGYALLPFLWAVNCFYFWPVLRHSRSFPRLRPYVVASAIGFSVFSVLLCSWALTFAIGGEHLFGPTWDQLQWQPLIPAFWPATMQSRAVDHLLNAKKVPLISDDLALECEGKDKYKCGSNVFWKW